MDLADIALVRDRADSSNLRDMGSVALNRCSLSRESETFRLYILPEKWRRNHSNGEALSSPFFASTVPHSVEWDGEESNFAITNDGSESKRGAEWIPG